MLISIIIPVYKVENYLRQCLDSLLCQINNEIEIILVDDGSPDKCPKICDEYAKKYNFIKVIHKTNQGVSIARQLGVEKSIGEYISFIDSDDWVETRFIESMKKIINNYHPDIICYGGYLVYENVRTENPFPLTCKLYNRTEIVKEIFPYLIENERGKYFPNGLAGKIIRRDLYLQNQVKNTTIMMGEDAACTKPCIFHAKTLYIDCGLYYNYRRTADSVTISGKPLRWDGPALIAQHYKKHIDLTKYGLQDQVDRNVVHNLFNVAVSQFSRYEAYSKISSNIRKELNKEVYSYAILNAQFSSLEGKLCKFAVKHRISFIFYLRWLQKYHSIHNKKHD